MHVVSTSRLPCASVLWQPRAGTFALTVVCKVTLALAPLTSSLAEAQDELHEDDGYWNDDERRSLVAPSDLLPFKRRADVFVVGHAHAPGGSPAPSVTARLVVGTIDKTIEVTGDRTYDVTGRPTDPAPFVQMSLFWERAAGGPGTANPVGVRPDDGSVPNLLPAGAQPVRGAVLPPVGFGPVAPTWPARAARVRGDAAGWNASTFHARPPPEGFDQACMNVAPLDQQLDTLRGDERIVLQGLHPELRRLVTSLEPVVPEGVVEREGGTVEPLALRCDTLCIDTDRLVATLVWRGVVLLQRADEAGRVVLRIAPAAAPAPERPVDATIALPDAMHAPALPFRGEASGSPGPRVPAEPFGPAAPARPAPPEGAYGATPAQPDFTLPPLARSSPGLPFGAQGPNASPWAPAVPLAPVVPVAPRFGAPPPSPTGGDLTLPPPTSARHAALPMAEPLPGLPFGAPDPHATPWIAAVPSAPLVAEAPRFGAPPPAEADLTLPPTTAVKRVVPFEARPTLPEPPALPPEAPAPEPRAFFVERPALLVAPDEPETMRPPPPAPAPPPPRDEDYTLERCAKIAAALAMARRKQKEILDEHALDPAHWARHSQRWLRAIQADCERGKAETLQAYDGAYVAELEAERGPILVEEYARLAVAQERSCAPRVRAELSLPAGSEMRVQRTWMRRMTEDAGLRRQVREAMRAARAG